MRLYIDLTPGEQGDIAGWVNYYRDRPNEALTRIVLSDRSRARYDQIASQFAAPVPPPSTDPLARILAAPSQWAKVAFASDAEMSECVRRGYWSDNDRHVLTNWWHDNGVRGVQLLDGRYQYATYLGGMETLHIDTGGADAATEQASGKRIPGPALP